MAPTSTCSTAAPAGVGTPRARPVSTMRPASFAASPSANCVGPLRVSMLSTMRSR